jgi:ribosomal-protein-alanine N-acetyltransferase
VIAGEGELMRIAVHPELRGRGLSRKLMDQLEETAREKGAEALTLEVRKSNRTAIELYKSYGFGEEAVRKNYYENPAEDALIMWLYFS